jgi:CRP-like cAMP-binding protein
MARNTPEGHSEEDIPIIGSPEDIVWKGAADELACNQLKLKDLPEFRDVRGILFPDDDFVRYWQLVVALLLIYTATITIFRIAFVEDEETGWLIADTVIDSLFFVDVTVNCFLAYYDFEMNLVTGHKAIVLHYLRTWMLIDLVSCLPFQYILDSGKNYSNAVRVARLPRLYKLVKVTKMMRMLKIFKDRSKLQSYVQGVIQISMGLERLIWMLVTFLLLIHIIACFWVLIGKLDETNENWIFQTENVDSGYYELYVVSFYWSITTLATVGYGDIRATNSTEMIICSFVMLIGIFLYSYVISSITSLIGNLDVRKSKLSKKMGLLNELSRQFSISKLFYKKLSKAIEYQNSRSMSFELSELIDGLPSKVRSELLYVIHRKMIESSTFFEGKSLYFVAEVAELLKPQKADMHEVIYREDEFAVEMYLIYKGEVSFMLMPEMIPYMVISEKYYFGETDILVSDKGRHTATAMSNTTSEMFTIDKDKLLRLLDKHPEIKIEMHTLAKERLERNEESKRRAREEFLTSFQVKRHSSSPQSFVTKNRFVNMIVKKQLNKQLDFSQDSEDISDRPTPASWLSGLKRKKGDPVTTDFSDKDEFEIEPFDLRLAKNTSDLNMHEIVQRVTLGDDRKMTRNSTYAKLKKTVGKLEESLLDIQQSQTMILERLDSVISSQRFSSSIEEVEEEEDTELDS